MPHTDAEIRGMIEMQRQAVEKVAVLCAQEKYNSTVYALSEALKWLQEAKLRAVGEWSKKA